MPTYEYECSSCGHRFEEFQGIMDKSIRTCPRCGGEVKRLISGGGGLLFKGSGFYITDYRSESYKKREKEEKKTTSQVKPKDVASKPAKKES
jgi:putative FmdB family regulatory protein